MSELEDFGYVLDFLPTGRPADRTREPVAQLIGTKYFTLLEVSIKPGAALNIEQKVNIGRDNRVEVERIKLRLDVNQLSNTARTELMPVLRKIIAEREADFVSFFNKCGSVSIRLHQLELLPGVGKKHLEELLAQRESKQFSSFADIQNRVALLTDPANIIVQRVYKELTGVEKHYLFVKPPATFQSY
ncbi:DUF655 domain-containing protein [Candidatus Parvarchaeota archaeon]|nr:DUF655 domain-containing protein [Candidatus Parvarchaeota archaeon]